MLLEVGLECHAYDLVLRNLCFKRMFSDKDV